MIAALRRAHRRLHAALWPVAFAVVVAALATRRPVDAPSDWPAFLARVEQARTTATGRAGSTSESRPLWSRDDAFGAWPARLTVYGDGQLELRPRRPLDRPELLLYWIPGALDGDRLPGDARLLGRVTGTHAQRFSLPRGGGAGSLVLFSLGHGTIVASARLEPAARAGVDPAAAAEGSRSEAGAR